MSGRVKPRVVPSRQGATGILDAIKQASRSRDGYKCPKCSQAIASEQEFEEHLAAHIETWQQDLARCFDRG